MDLSWTDPQGNSTRRLTRGFFIMTRMRVSRDGIVAFVPGNVGMQNLHSIRIADSATIQHTGSYGQITVFGWSPNGKQLAFAASPKGAEMSKMFAYYILDYESRSITRIPNAEAFYPSLSWSPDGGSVALLARGLETVNVKTNWRRQLPRSPGAIHNLTWSPDGQYLALERQDEECHRFSHNIYVIRISDNTERKVSKRLFHCRTYDSPAWSLDGKQLVFVASRSKPDMDFTPFTKTLRDNIYVVNRDGSNQVNVSGNEDVPDTNPMWCKEPSK
jgi:Tol biopolymer transport system component